MGTQDTKILLDKALAQHQVGDFRGAELKYRRVLELHPEKADVYNNLGIALHQQGNLDHAADAYGKAVALNPDLVEAHFNLGNVYQQQMQLAAAVDTYRKVIQLKPDYIQAYCELGKVFNQQEDFGRALEVFRLALQLEIEDTEIYAGLAHTYFQQQRLAEALQAYERAIELDSERAQFHYSRGVVLKAMGQIQPAIQSYVRALRCQPDYFEAHNNLGSLLQETDRFDLAVQAFQQAVKCKPDYARGYANLGSAYKSLNQLPEAKQAYNDALRIQPNLHQAKFGLCMSQLPIIYNSDEQILQCREQYRRHLEELVHYYDSQSLVEQAAAAAVVGTVQPFYLTYQGLNDQDLQRTYGRLVAQLMASQFPQWSVPLQPRHHSGNDRIRVGIVSGFFHNHSNWKIPIKGWVQQLNRDRFELFGYYTRELQDAETNVAIAGFDHFLQGPWSVEAWATAIRHDQLDVLIFPEFGMDPTTIRLGGLRLAPVQATSWGHPETSGLPTIDYYLSSDLMEPENGQEGYTEALVRLPNLSIYYEPLSVIPKVLQKSDLGLAEDEVFYWCCQSLYKYLPQYDNVFAQIAVRLPASRFVFIAHGSSRPVNETFHQRLREAFQQVGLDYSDYCRFLPPMSVDCFAGVSALADVFLDSIGWSGCNSSLEVIAHHVPPVTLPGQLMRGRHTSAILEMMGLAELIADNQDDYIERAVRLGKDPLYRQRVSQTIAENKHRLYRDCSTIRALEDWLIDVVGKAFAS